MKIQVGKTYINKKNKYEVKVDSVYGGNDEMYVKYRDLDDQYPYEASIKQFADKFTDVHSKTNVNQDILKFIEAGYEFTSFWGDTVDERSINVDLNEGEVKQ